jgi:hypothetical protein
MMNPDDRKRMEGLCAQIAVETDSSRFSVLMQQLIDLLDRSHHSDVEPQRSSASSRQGGKLAPGESP